MTSSPTNASLKGRRRSDYLYWQKHQTRWSDNDQYAHMNNATSYNLIDSVINTYLIKHCGLKPPNSPLLGLVVTSSAQYFSSLSFPDALDLGLRVNAIGKSSVTYEVGIFKEGSDTPAVVGGYTHVFVENVSRKSTALSSEIHAGLSKIYVPTSKL